MRILGKSRRTFPDVVGKLMPKTGEYRGWAFVFRGFLM
jgi:hypothetical protein